MKKVMAIIRPTEANATKKALEDAGFPGFTCLKVLGRGKEPADYQVVSDKPLQDSCGSSSREPTSSPSLLNRLHTMLSKQLLILLLHDDDVKTVVNIIIKTNSKGRQGDGKIFIIDINEAVSIHTLEKGDEAI